MGWVRLVEGTSEQVDCGLEEYVHFRHSKEVRLNSHYLQESCAMSFKTFLVGFSGLAISAFIGCGDKESSPTAPISADNVDTNALITAICAGSCGEENIELVFDGVIENGGVKTGQVETTNHANIVEFTLPKDADVTVTLDGETDIAFALLKVIDNGTDYTIVATNDDDDDSPLDGYDDRSQGNVSLKKGRHLVVIVLPEDSPQNYRLQIEWM